MMGKRDPQTFLGIVGLFIFAALTVDQSKPA
jgi:hypothetical protein